MSEKRYLRVWLSDLQAKVASRLSREHWASFTDIAEKRKAMQETSVHQFSPTRVTEEDALNECAPEGYRMISREVAGICGDDAIYTFERLPQPSTETSKPPLSK